MDKYTFETQGQMLKPRGKSIVSKVKKLKSGGKVKHGKNLAGVNYEGNFETHRG